MLLAETSFMGAVRDAMGDGEINSFHHPIEHNQCLENDNLKYMCGCFEPIYSGDNEVGIVHLFHHY